MTAVVDQRKAARRKKPKKRAYAADWSGRPAAMEFCQCIQCDSKTDWPAYYVGSGRLYVRKGGRRRGLRYNRSYECYLERNPPKKELADRAQKAAVRTESDARREGMSVRQRGRRSIWTATLQGPCESCEGLRPRNRRFCLACEATMKRAMDEAGWDAEQTEAYLTGKL